MSSFGAVLDACVLFPAALRDTLLRTADAGLYRAHWSGSILDEVRRNLVDQRRTTEQQALRLIDVINEYFPESAVTGFEALIDGMTNDPKDRHVLAAALKAGAQVIVTANIKDFPDAALDRYGIEAQSPDEFLLHLLDLEPEQMVRIVTQQAADLRNPAKTLDDVLDELALHAPGFAAAIRDSRSSVAQ
jgi:predicted nucleic acid-binding protein